VGAGKQPPAWARQLLESRDRALAAPTFAAQGLYLEAVEYGAGWHIPDGSAGRVALPVVS
jgi:tRNA pseudouridine38-40 synthase